MNYKIILVIAVLFLFGCPVYHLNNVPESRSLTSPAKISVSGPYNHTYSKTTFPERVSTFLRVNVTQYDSGGTNVSIGYNDLTPTCPIIGTIYVFPRPPMNYVGAAPEVVSSLEEKDLRNAFEATKSDIVRNHTDALAVSEKSMVFGKKKALAAVYKIGANISIAKLMVYDRDWLIKYRYTFPTSCENKAIVALGNLEGGLSLY